MHNDVNIVKLSGDVITAVEDASELSLTGTYVFTLGVKRTSGYVDEIQIVFSESLMLAGVSYENKRVYVEGQLRRKKSTLDNGRIVRKYYVYADKLQILPDNDDVDVNYICVIGEIQCSPKRRETASKLVVCDLYVDRITGKGRRITIPCICWNADADFAASRLHKGDFVKITGRLQADNYGGRTGRQTKAKRIEVSVQKLLCMSNIK